MEQTWRWFGPKDPVPLAHVRQAGATGIVSALHDHYRGEVWPEDAIAERKALYEKAAGTLLAEGSVVYLYHRLWIIAHTAKLDGFKLLPDGLVRVVGLRLK